MTTLTQILERIAEDAVRTHCPFINMLRHREFVGRDIRVAIANNWGIVFCYSPESYHDGLRISHNDIRINTNDAMDNIKNRLTYFAKRLEQKAFDELVEIIPPQLDCPDIKFGVDRTVNPDVLSGIRLIGQDSMLDTIHTGLVKVCEYGGESDIVYIPPSKHRQLSYELASKRCGTNGIHNYMEEPAYEAINIYGPRGVVPVIANPYIPQDTAYILDKDSLDYNHMGRIVNIDIMQNEDTYETRMSNYSRVSCMAPGYNCVIVFEDEDMITINTIMGERKISRAPYEIKLKEAEETEKDLDDLISKLEEDIDNEY